MGTALEVVTGRVLNPGTTLTTVTANTGDSMAVKSAPFEAGIFLEGVWAEGATTGDLSIRSPRLHDNTRGIQLTSPGNNVRNLFGDEVVQRLFPQDALTVQLSGGAAETDVIALLIYYRDLPGVAARLAMWDQIAPRIVNILTVQSTVAGPTTAGDWSAGEAIDVDSDLLKANVDYAVLGYTVDTQVCAVAIRGPETGNLRVGGPGPVEAIETRDWFVSLSKAKGTPHIPIFNAANKSSTLIFVADAVAGATPEVNLVLAELSSGT